MYCVYNSAITRHDAIIGYDVKYTVQDKVPLNPCKLFPVLSLPRLSSFSAFPSFSAAVAEAAGAHDFSDWPLLPEAPPPSWQSLGGKRCDLQPYRP